MGKMPHVYGQKGWPRTLEWFGICVTRFLNFSSGLEGFFCFVFFKLLLIYLLVPLEQSYMG